MTIESGIIFGDFATLPSPVRAIRIVGRGKGMSGAKLRKKANRPTGRRHGCGHSRLPFASTRFRGHVSHSEPAAYRRIRSEDRRRDGPRGVPHESGLRALSVLLMAACCILGVLRGGSHEPAVDCKARHGRFREKERLFVSVRNDARTSDDSPVRLFGGCRGRFLLRNSASGNAVRFFRSVRRKTALACERRMLGLCVPVPLAFVPSAGYSPAMKSRMARSCASMLCRSRN